MKELSIEQKAKRYDEAIEIAKEINNEQRAQPFNVMTRVFPELRESEDERIRNKLLKIFREAQPTDNWGGLSTKDIIAWLEKQGEQKPADKVEPKFKVGDKIWHKNYKGECTHHIIRIENDNYIGDDNTSISISTADKEYELVEKQGEQKPIDHDTLIQQRVDALADIVAEQKPADKVKSKFKAGDWISGYYTSYKVLSVNNDGYVVEDVDGNKINILFENEKFHHLWTIQDAKDGDVLINWNNTIFIFKAIEDETVKFHIAYNEKWYTIKTPLTKLSHMGLPEPQFEFCPATKEQCDLLFQRMKEAGYEWDAKNKKLKGIEWIWSEEDEELYNDLVDTYFYNDEDYPEDTYKHMLKKILDWMNKRAKYLRPQKQEWSEEDKEMRMNVLKFLSTRCNVLEYEKVECWLNSLKNRVQPQLKKEWSEEDKTKINYLIALLQNCTMNNNDLRVMNEEIEDWLKSLHPSWKPSDEQMVAINTAINVIGKGTLNGKQLIELEEQLKKLKGK